MRLITLKDTIVYKVKTSQVDRDSNRMFVTLHAVLRYGKTASPFSNACSSTLEYGFDFHGVPNAKDNVLKLQEQILEENKVWTYFKDKSQEQILEKVYETIASFMPTFKKAFDWHNLPHEEKKLVVKVREVKDDLGKSHMVPYEELPQVLKDLDMLSSNCSFDDELQLIPFCKIQNLLQQLCVLGIELKDIKFTEV